MVDGYNGHMHSSLLKSVDMPSNKKFGWLFAAIFSSGFAYFQYKNSTGLATTSLLASVIFIATTIYKPAALAPLNRAWFALSILLGKVVSPIVLSIIFFAVIAPIAIITRLFGRDELSLNKRKVPSYWVDKESIDPESFKNQF
jgi:hypothetical protein